MPVPRAVKPRARLHGAPNPGCPRCRAGAVSAPRDRFPAEMARGSGPFVSPGQLGLRAAARTVFLIALGAGVLIVN